jgi:hypothetical protein
VAVQQQGDVVFVAPGWGQLGHQGGGEGVDGQCAAVMQHAGGAGDAGIQGLAAAFDQAVGVEQEGGAGREGAGGFGARSVRGVEREGRGLGVMEEFGG